MRHTLRALCLIVLTACAAPAHAGWTCIQPNATEGMDTWYGSYNQSGMPTSDRLAIGGYGNSQSALVRFNMGGLATQATEADLFLYAFSSGIPAAINWWLPIVNWQETTAGFYNQPSVYGGLLGTTPAPASGWYGVNITGLYNMWRSGTNYLNHGLKLSSGSSNHNITTFFSSDTGNSGYRPVLCVNSNSTETRIVLKWPLSTSYASRQINQGFDVPWSRPKDCPAGVRKRHNGIDYAAAPETAVYAMEDGWVRHSEPHDSDAYHIVIEHNHPNRVDKFTTTSWHVIPVPGLKVGDFVPKGMQIATVANMGTATHFHAAVRIGAYDAIVSGVGAVPKETCTDPNGVQYPGIASSGFINPEDASRVVFQ